MSSAVAGIFGPRHGAFLHTDQIREEPLSDSLTDFSPTRRAQMLLAAPPGAGVDGPNRLRQRAIVTTSAKRPGYPPTANREVCPTAGMAVPTVAADWFTSPEKPRPPFPIAPTNSAFTGAAARPRLGTTARKFDFQHLALSYLEC
ncbi:hypothetical protein KL953_08530 [Mycolicibacterium goodii]|uniref:hypothetical protein n=1 Tax=Mycolicibacterium goodii TaxID=134601 RepID=UPI001BDBD5EE|nr:hypothetical protein [Mycolicibacterium goodii]MBU8808940.1 hypothetical protein [Mycolicibacterium goodii]